MTLPENTDDTITLVVSDATIFDLIRSLEDSITARDTRTAIQALAKLTRYLDEARREAPG